MPLSTSLHNLFGVVLTSEDDSDDEAARTSAGSDDDIPLAGQLPEAAPQQTPEQIVSAAIARIRADKKSSYTPREARRKGGQRTKDLELMNRNLFDDQALEDSTCYDCACEGLLHDHVPVPSLIQLHCRWAALLWMV